MNICIPCEVFPNCGFCATILALAKLCYVIIDMYKCKLSDIYLDSSNYKNPYIIGNDLPILNVFSKYFSCFSTNTNNIKLSNNFYNNVVNTDNIAYKLYEHIVKQILCSLQLNIKNKINHFLSKINIQNTLGIKFRETDYLFRPVNHPKQLDRKNFIKNIIQFLIKNKNILQLFVATESNGFINELNSNEFILRNNIKIISTKNKIFINGKKHETLLKTQNIDDCFNLNTDYLIDIFVISKLKYLILNLTTSNNIINTLRDTIPIYQNIIDLGYYKKQQLILAQNAKYIKEKHIYLSN